MVGAWLSDVRDSLDKERSNGMMKFTSYRVMEFFNEVAIAVALKKKVKKDRQR